MAAPSEACCSGCCWCGGRPGLLFPWCSCCLGGTTLAEAAYLVPPLPPPPQAVIRQNLILAVGSIAALSLPTVLGWVPLWFAVMLHEGSTLLVALNSLRLLRFGSGLRNWRDASQQQQQAQPEAAAESKGDGPQERSRTARTGGTAAPVIA